MLIYQPPPYLSQTLKAPSEGVAAGGFLLADNLLRLRQLLKHQKIIIRVALLC